MATLVFTDASVKINTVDLSDHVKSVKVNYSADLLDATAMGMTSKARKGGLKDWDVEIEFYQDYAASKIDATNPRYSGNGIIDKYPPYTGGVGEMGMAPVTMQGSDGVPLTRAAV